MSQLLIELVCPRTGLNVCIPKPVDLFDLFWTSDPKLWSDYAEST